MTGLSYVPLTLAKGHSPESKERINDWAQSFSSSNFSGTAAVLSGVHRACLRLVGQRGSLCLLVCAARHIQMQAGTCVADWITSLL